MEGLNAEFLVVINPVLTDQALARNASAIVVYEVAGDDGIAAGDGGDPGELAGVVIDAVPDDVDRATNPDGIPCPEELGVVVVMDQVAAAETEISISEHGSRVGNPVVDQHAEALVGMDVVRFKDRVTGVEEPHPITAIVM